MQCDNPETGDTPDKPGGVREHQPALLALDADPDSLTRMAGLLSRRLRVLCAGTGRRGLAHLEGNRVSVVVGDLRLPDMAGSEFLAASAALQPLAPHILLAPHGGSEAVVAPEPAVGVFAYARKPWCPVELETLVQSALAHHDAQLDRLRQIAELEQANAKIDQCVRERTLELEQKASELQKALAEISELAHKDSLTGAANRRMLDEVLLREARRAARLKSPLSAILLDLDHFKCINDAFGHGVGDVVLTAVARALIHGVRAYDLVARYGGEEFVVLLPHADLAQGVLVAERLRRVLSAINVPGCSCVVTASFGVACLQPGEASSQLLVQADCALYAAKRGGRDRVEAYRGGAGAASALGPSPHPAGNGPP